MKLFGLDFPNDENVDNRSEEAVETFKKTLLGSTFPNIIVRDEWRNSIPEKLWVGHGQREYLDLILSKLSESWKMQYEAFTIYHRHCQVSLRSRFRASKRFLFPDGLLGFLPGSRGAFSEL